MTVLRDRHVVLQLLGRDRHVCTLLFSVVVLGRGTVEHTCRGGLLLVMVVGLLMLLLESLLGGPLLVQDS